MFAPDEWDVAQPIRFVVPDDLVDRGAPNYLEGLRANMSCAAPRAVPIGTCDEFDGAAQLIELLVVDDDEAKVLVERAPVDVLFDAAGDCYEAEGSYAFRVRLATEPLHNATITLGSDPSGLLDSAAGPAPHGRRRAPSPSRRATSTSRGRSACAQTRTASSSSTRPGTLNVTSADGFLRRLRAAAERDRARAHAARDGLPPELVEAKLADLGQGLTVSFRDDTNRAGLGGEWDCDERGRRGATRGPARARRARGATRARCGCSSAAART